MFEKQINTILGKPTQTRVIKTATGDGGTLKVQLVETPNGYEVYAYANKKMVQKIKNLDIKKAKQWFKKIYDEF